MSGVSCCAAGIEIATHQQNPTDRRTGIAMKFLPHRLRATFAATLLATVAFSAAASAGCGSCCCRAATYGSSAVPMYESSRVTPSYVVNQGPVYSGPAISVPVLTYSESLSAHGYPYVRGTRGYYVRGHGDVYYGDAPSHRRPYLYHGHHPRVHGAADARSNVVRARAEVRYLSPERMEIKLQRDQKPRKPRRHHED
jgi:hypothetical protein